VAAREVAPKRLDVLASLEWVFGRSCFFTKLLQVLHRFLNGGQLGLQGWILLTSVLDLNRPFHDQALGPLEERFQRRVLGLGAPAVAQGPPPDGSVQIEISPILPLHRRAVSRQRAPLDLEAAESELGPR